MNTHVMHAQREVKLKPFMQKYPFCQETGASYMHLDQVIQSGEVALHLIDGKVQIETLEALRALTKFKTGRYGRSTRYGHFAQLVAQMESELVAQKDSDLFA
jgi:hypothetical protein